MYDYKVNGMLRAYPGLPTMHFFSFIFLSTDSMWCAPYIVNDKQYLNGRAGDRFSTLILVGTCCLEFESGPMQIPIFEEKVTHSKYQSVQFWPKIYAIFSPNFLKLEPNLAQIWENFESRPVQISKFCIK